MVKNKRAETPGHNLTCHLVAHFIEMMGHKAEIEADFGDYIADVYDWETGIAYEVQTINDKKTEADKVRRATLHGEINDVIFIYLGTYCTGSIINSKKYQKLKYKIIGE